MNGSINLDDIVRKSIHALREELGKQWLSNRMFGVKLHANVARRIARIRPMDGWYIAAEKPVRSMPFVRRDLLEQKLLDYLQGAGAGMHMYRDEVARLTRSGAKVGDLQPDLVVRPPDGSLVVWDLTSQQNDHLIKTMLYAQVLTALGQHTRIGETYWLQKEGF